MADQDTLLGLHVATLDDPAPPLFAPRLHMFADDRLPWLAVHDDLPRFPDNRLPHPAARQAPAVTPP